MRTNLALVLQIILVVTLLAVVSVGGGWRMFWHWLLFAISALQMPVRMWGVDGAATLLTVAVFMIKLLLGLAPTVMLFVCAPRWRVLSGLFAAATLFVSVAFVRACPYLADWIALCVLSALGVVLVRYRFLRWAAGLPLIVLLLIPAQRHDAEEEGAYLSPACADNDGERPINLKPEQFSARYHGVQFIPPDWILLIGETPAEGRFMNTSHGGQGSWWLRRQPDGRLAFHGPSAVTGNIWTSCLLGGDAWLIRAGWFIQVRPPTPDGDEMVQRYPFEMIGFDAPATACDERTGAVFGSDLLDGRLLELRPHAGGQVERRPDFVSDRGGLMAMRERDGRLIIFDFQDLIVYAPGEFRVVQRTPAAIISSSLALCQADGAVAIPDLAGRLRVFRMESDGDYDFEFGVGLIAPRFAAWSPDCAFIGVTSADDDRVWVIERASRRVVETFHLGPVIRGAAFIAPRELAVADACTLSVLRF